ncbi:hypothetical protein BC834DRAFT_965607 [Gloeopeniophorella convolvens]|nr:hypothetical protein BC834DRAFT_965607 [Gloeopeniophorella convolvens]
MASNSTAGDADIPGDILTLWVHLLIHPCRPGWLLIMIHPLYPLPSPAFFICGFAYRVGPILIGNLLSWFLFGVLTMQLYVYYLAFPKDSLWIRFTAYGLFLFDLGQTIVITQVAWSTLCSGWGKPAALVHTSWGFALTPVASGIISAWVQIFFAWRVWVLGKNLFWKTVTTAIVAVALAQGTAAVAAGIKYAGINDAEKISEINPMVSVWLGGSVAADAMIAASMVYLLVGAKKHTTWNKKTNRRLTKLIRSTVETGVVSAAAASLDLGFYFGFSHNNLHTTIAIMLSKLYSNALMASLNSRAGVYERFLPPGPHNGEYPTHGRITTLQFNGITSLGGGSTALNDGKSVWLRTSSKQSDSQRGIALDDLAEV